MMWLTEKPKHGTPTDRTNRESVPAGNISGSTCRCHHGTVYRSAHHESKRNGATNPGSNAEKWSIIMQFAVR